MSFSSPTSPGTRSPKNSIDAALPRGRPMTTAVLRATRFVSRTRATTVAFPGRLPVRMMVSTKPFSVRSSRAVSVASSGPSSVKLTRMPFFAGRPCAFSTRNWTIEACGFAEPVGPIAASKPVPWGTNSMIAASPCPPGVLLGSGSVCRCGSETPPPQPAAKIATSNSAFALVHVLRIMRSSTIPGSLVLLRVARDVEQGRRARGRLLGRFAVVVDPSATYPTTRLSARAF